MKTFPRLSSWYVLGALIAVAAVSAFITGCSTTDDHPIAPAETPSQTVLFSKSLYDQKQVDETRENQARSRYTEATLEIDCRESSITSPIDYSLARALVPNEYSLWTDENGKAQTKLIIQECSSALWNGEQLSPLTMNNVWLRVNGPYEVIPIPGYPPFPTQYWYGVGDWSTNKRFFKIMKKAFTKEFADLVPEIHFGKPVNGMIHSWVREKKPVADIFATADKDHFIGWRWTEQVNYTTLSSAGVYRFVYKDGDKYDSFLVIFFAQFWGINSPSVISIHPESSLAVLGSQLNGNGAEFDVQATLWLTLDSYLPPW